MATSAFKSTTKRTSIGTNTNTADCGSSNRTHRRSRSLSQFSRRLEPAPDFGDDPASKGRLVNNARRSGFPEISLDDLAIEFFPTKVYLDETYERGSDSGRLSRRSSEISPSNSIMASSQRRGRSVTRHNSHSDDGNGRLHIAGGGAVPDSISRRRRSVSVARRRTSDCESDAGHFQTSSWHAHTKSLNSRNREMASTQKPQASVQRRLERSVSHEDLSKSHDDYSSHSSTVTDDEVMDAHYGKDGIEKIMEAVFARKKAEHPIGDDENSGLYEAVRKELRYAVEEIRTELEQAMVGKTSGLSDDPLKSGNSSALWAFSAVTKSYATKLEKSEKRKQDLLAEMEMEEQRGRELSEKVRELLPDTKKSAVAQKSSLTRKKSNDKNRMSKRLAEEAGKYFEDFISNVEDTEISSFDGEKSDSSSTLRGSRSRVASTQSGETESYQSPALYNSLLVEMNGVNFPWLKWDTADDEGSPLVSKTKAHLPITPKSLCWDAPQEEGSIVEDPSSQSTSSSRGSCSPGFLDSDSISKREEERGSKACDQSSSFDMEEYVKLERNEQLLSESWTERHRINSGSLLLCHNLLF